MNRKIFLAVFFCIFLLYVSPTGYGQRILVVRDLRAIQELAFNVSLPCKLEAEIGAKTIFQEDISRFGEVSLSPELSWKPLRYCSLGGGYQWSDNRHRNGDLLVRHRFYGWVSFDAKTGRFRFDYRLMYQNQDDEVFGNDDLYEARHIMRNRLQIRYNIRNLKLTPYVSAEHYQHFGYGGLKVRLTAGTSYSIGDHHTVRMYYRIDQQLNAAHPYTIHNLGIAYKFRV